MSYSLSIGGSNYAMRPWPQPTIAPAIRWMTDAAGYPNGSDRGSSQDGYMATALFQGRESTLNALEQTLDANREAVTLASFQTPLFAPNVDHTGSISAVVEGYSRNQVQWGNGTDIYGLEVQFRAIAPTLLGTTPSLATLRYQDGAQAGHSHTSPKAFTYDQTAVYGDRRSDIGLFEGEFSQTTAEIQAILAYLLTTARASAIAFPSALSAVVDYPFGRSRGTPGNCRVTGFEIGRKNLNRWSLKLQLAEAP